MNKQEELQQEITALADKYGFEAKVELTEKKRSLKLADIVEMQKNSIVYWPYSTGIIKSEKLDIRYTAIDQIKESSARKSMLFGQIQRIADFANGDWVPENECRSIIAYLRGSIGVFTIVGANYGMPYFKSEQLAKQAYEDNKEIFDEFFKL